MTKPPKLTKPHLPTATDSPDRILTLQGGIIPANLSEALWSPDHMVCFQPPPPSTPINSIPQPFQPSIQVRITGKMGPIFRVGLGYPSAGPFLHLSHTPSYLRPHFPQKKLWKILLSSFRVPEHSPEPNSPRKRVCFWPKADNTRSSL